MKAIRSQYTKKADEKLTPDEVRALTAGLVRDGVALPVIASRWALIFSVLAFLTSLVALVIVLRTR